MVDAPKAAVALLSLALTASLVACSADGDPKGAAAGGGNAQGKGVSDNFPRKNVIVSAVCSPGNGRGEAVKVDGWDPRSWKHVAHAEFKLPDTAVVQSDKARPNTAVRDLCEPQPEPASTSDTGAMRSLFDKDFTKMAVVTEDPKTGASHVGYVDRSGKFTDLTGTKDFGDTPHEDNAALSPDGKAIWFTYDVVEDPGVSTSGRVATRAIAGNHKAVDRLKVDVVGESRLTVLGSPARGVLAGGAHLSPDGKRLLADGYVLELPPGGRSVGRELIEKGEFLSCGEDWLDDDSVLCGSAEPADHRFAAFDASKDAKPGAPVLPRNDHENFAMVLSPDRQEFAFRSVKGTVSNYFLSGTKPGSTPNKVKKTGAFSTLGDGAVFIDWR